jgi:hypothetical protein
MRERSANENVLLEIALPVLIRGAAPGRAGRLT